MNSGVASGIPEDGGPILETDPPLAYDNMFYLNIFLPIRVRVVHVYSRSFRGRLWHHSLPAPPPPPVGVLDLVWENRSRKDVGLLLQSEAEFWRLHKAYPVARPGSSARVGGGNGGGSNVGEEVAIVVAVVVTAVVVVVVAERVAEQVAAVVVVAGMVAKQVGVEERLGEGR